MQSYTLRWLTNWLLPAATALVYFILYVPVVVLITFSFNDNPSGYQWTSFTTHWYHALWNSAPLWQACSNSLIVALVTVMLSISMGILFVYFGTKLGFFRIIPIFYANLAIPEIVIAAGLLSFFSFASVPFGLFTLVASHTLLGLGYVVPLLYVRFRSLDKSLIEASLDLGATQTQTFFNVVLPLLFPSIMASALLVFVISFDDFILSFFCAGAASQTLPIYIYSLIRSGATPIVNALSTLLLAVSLVVATGYILYQFSKEGSEQ